MSSQYDTAWENDVTVSHTGLLDSLLLVHLSVATGLIIINDSEHLSVTEASIITECILTLLLVTLTTDVT